jgi:hypothetical protein
MFFIVGNTESYTNSRFSSSIFYIVNQIVLLFILVSFSLLKLKIKYLLASEWNIVSFQSKENPLKLQI